MAAHRRKPEHDKRIGPLTRNERRQFPVYGVVARLEDMSDAAKAGEIPAPR
jgi:hypothetical protein